MKKISAILMILLFIPLISVGNEEDYQAEHSLQTIFEILFNWGKEAMGFSKYRWEGSRLQLKNNLVGSTIAVEHLEVFAPAIWMNSGRAYYEKFMGLPAPFNQTAAGQKLRSTRNYYEKCHIKDLSILIMDRDEKLAYDLVGLNNIDIFGSIREAEIYGSYIRLEIDLIEWSRSK